jgi:cobalt-zinc-cadmium efflux system outer membrane protein
MGARLLGRLTIGWFITIASLAPGSAAAEANSGELHENPTADLTLPQALALALRQNPSLATFSWDIRAAEAREIQARLRPNPEISLEIEDLRWNRGPGTSSERLGLNSPLTLETQTFTTPNGEVSVPAFRRSFIPEYETTRENGSESGLGEAEITLRLSQLIELGGKRAKRIAVARREQDVASWDYEVARADALANTAKAFYEVVATQERLGLANALAELTQQVEDTVHARVDAGKVSPIEFAKVEVESGVVRLAVERTRRELDAARISLASYWGATSATFTNAIGHFDETQALPPLDELRQQLETVPDLSRWMAEVDLREAAIELERANAKPDATVTLGFRSTGLGARDQQGYGLTGERNFGYSQSSIRPDDSREHSLVLGASIPLPLFHRNQGRIREAEYLALKASDQRRATEVQVSTTLTARYSLLEAAQIEASTLRSEVLPKAQEAFEATNEGYLQGKFGLLDVLFAQRTLFDTRSQILEAQSAYYQNLADVERFTGQALFAIPETNESHEEQP